jgi:hypothetical protein
MNKDQILRNHLSEIGRKGGSVKSEAKTASGKVNAAKALAARLLKLENNSK